LITPDHHKRTPPGPTSRVLLALSSPEPSTIVVDESVAWRRFADRPTVCCEPVGKRAHPDHAQGIATRAVTKVERHRFDNAPTRPPGLQTTNQYRLMITGGGFSTNRRDFF
jgi:hypothetical protein